MEERVCLKSLKEQSRELHVERLDKLQSQEGNFVFSLIEAFRSLSSSSCYESITSFREIESRERRKLESNCKQYSQGSSGFSGGDSPARRSVSTSET